MDDRVNIYGSLNSGATVIIGAGNFNHITALLAYYPNENLLQLRSLPEIVTPAVLELVLNYEKPITAQPNKLYFSLQVKQNNPITQTEAIAPNQDPLTQTEIATPIAPIIHRNKPKYINVQIEVEGDQKVATACISNERAIFSLDFSAIDRSHRGHLLAGSLYSLETILGEQTYVVSWKIHGFSNGDLIVFLPTTWWEQNQSQTRTGIDLDSQSGVAEEQRMGGDIGNRICVEGSGVDGLVNRLNQLQFQGFTSRKWCEDVPTVSHCPANTLCGPCLGQCLDPSLICYPNSTSFESNGIGSGSNSTLFRCGPLSDAPNMEEDDPITLAETLDTSPTTTGTTATWVAIIFIFIIVLLLAWGLATQLKIE